MNAYFYIIDINLQLCAILHKLIQKQIFQKFIIPTRIPYIATLNNIVKISEKENKPFDIEFWHYSLNKETIVVVNKETNEKILGICKEGNKIVEYYTSPIAKIYNSGEEYIIVTMLSVFVVDKEIRLHALLDNK